MVKTSYRFFGCAAASQHSPSGFPSGINNHTKGTPMITAAEQYRALVARLEAINPSEPEPTPVDSDHAEVKTELTAGTYYPGQDVSGLYSAFKL